MRKISLLIWLLAGMGQLWAADSLRMGLIRYKDEASFKATYEPLMTYLAEKLQQPLKLEILPEDELGYRLAQNEFDLGLFTAFPYLKARLDFPELEVFASHQVNGTGQYEGAILVRTNSGIRELSGLKDKRFLFVKSTSTSGYKYPKGIFKEHGIDVDADFLGYSFSGGHAASVRALLKGETDGIAIDLRGLEAFSDEEVAGLLALDTFAIPYHAYVLAPGLPQEERERIKTIMFDAHKDPMRKAIFQNPLNIQQWLPQEDSYYNSLRRYLGMLRVKPLLHVRIDPKASAQKALEAQGDLLELLKDHLLSEIRQSRRFSYSAAEPTGSFQLLRVDLSLVGQQYHCQAFLDEDRIFNADVNLSQFHSELPALIMMAVLKARPIETPLLTNGQNWFITYGEEDGLNTENYEFGVELEEGEWLEIKPGEIASMTALNTFFDAHRSFRKGQKVVASFVQTRLNAYLRSTNRQVEGGFWDHLDNVWGVIGLLVAFASLALGGYFTRRKQRRFRRMLQESNTLLKGYIDGKYQLDSQVLEQKEKISRYLEKGYISENQFLILKQRLEDIHEVINHILMQSASVPPEVQLQVREIIRDGVITEKEYAQLMKLVRSLN